LWRDSQPRKGEVRRSSADFSVLVVNVWLGLTLAAIFVPTVLQDLGLARLSTMILDGLRIGQGAAYIGVVLGLATRQREQWMDLERCRAVPQPSAAALR
ncbi:MAG TPA: hypothetical protein VF945_21930, partial [Polyangia bacterium]